ncbi:MAG: AMIN domain-containing protein [Desulfovibrio sp.]|nr:AMIN domain-containing protein [Desulfovibrio sp.]MBI4958362.1 AMIN domain-containing protein [Desulfovibrio sp.]
MTDKNKVFILKVVLVVVAVALGFSLNMLSVRSPFISPGPQQVTSQQGGKQDAQSEQSAGKQEEQAPAPVSGEKPESVSRPEEKIAAPQEPMPAPADSQVVAAAPAAAPASSDGDLPKERASEKDEAKPASAAAEAKQKDHPALAGVSDPGTDKTGGMDKAGKTGAGAGQPGTAGTEAKETKQAKPEKKKTGAQEKTVSEATDKQTDKAVPAKGGKVVDVTAQDNPGEFVLTITTDGPVERVTSFYAKDPARLAVDIWGVWQPGVPGVIAVGGPIMERIRIGSHPDKLRLVVDYRDKESSGFSEPVVEKTDKGVVVRVPKSKKPQ